MGVHQLWTIVAPCARPIKLETLNQRRLAVDASIWIYQFLKAVRDKEGNVLRNSHIVGFYYRICKLLYHGIKPVFVFDGGAPALKRRVITERKKRREGKRDDAVRTAGRLLAVQMQRRAEEEQQRAKDNPAQPLEEEPLPEELVYADEIGMSAKEKQRSRQFKKKDQYHLPDLDVSLAEMGGPNDPRVMSHEELEEYARQFKNGEDVSFYDFSKIDFDSPMFTSLPAADRYNILNAKRIRSRLRMGYSKEQLASMFPDSMAFSRFQMERVRERNELTQRLMNINGMAEDFAYQTGRIAGEKGKEYILVQNSAAEGGWALGVIQRDGPIDLDADEPSPKLESDLEEDDFEDVPIEGLNRLPRKWTEKKQPYNHETSHENVAQHIAEKRKAVYEGRRKTTESQTPRYQPKQPVAEDDTALFVADANPPVDINDSDEPDNLFEDVDLNQNNSDDDLQKAIQMSLEQPKDDNSTFLMAQSGEESDDGMDLQAALEESRKSKYRPTQPFQRRISSPPMQTLPSRNVETSGPLPFESLNLGQSILGQKKAEQIRETQSGGFDRDGNVKEKSRPLPPWFNAENVTGESMREQQVGQVDEEPPEETGFIARQAIQRNETNEIIDVDKEEVRNPDIIDLEAERERSSISSDSSRHSPWLSSQASVPLSRKGDVASVPRMQDLAENIRAKPPFPDSDIAPRNDVSARQDLQATNHASNLDEPIEWSDSDREEKPTSKPMVSNNENLRAAEVTPSASIVQNGRSLSDSAPTAPPKNQESDSEDNALFVDVDQSPPLAQEETLDPEEQALADQYLIHDEPDIPNNGSHTQNQAAEASDHYDSDSDEELFATLAAEAEANAQFASGLNQRSTAENLAVYEDELKRLRAQQKRDRRDADEVTNNMTEEVQILLSLFGLPYITAPMEAEAQCAELVRLGLVDGVVTDDSDIFLFGGTRVYKNFFNGKKNVELYLASDLEKEYNLTRDKLIASAQILGSDYAEHLKGIGPVKALELLSEWGSLPSFRDWWSVNQLRDPKEIKTDPFLSAERKKFHKRFSAALMLPSNWPSSEVENAYWNPTVDSDTQKFEWGVPQLNRLREFFMATIGWTSARTDEILVPIVRDMAKREREGTQGNLTRWFGGSAGTGAAKAASAGRGGANGSGSGKGEVGAPTRRVESTRMARALGRLKRREEESINMNTNGEGHGDGAANTDAGGDADDDADAEANAEPETPKPKRRRGRKADAAKGQGQGNAKKRRRTAKA